MSANEAVVWTQGMFLQPQHFQQQARHARHVVDVRVRAAHPLAWGFSELVLDESMLALGRVAVQRASGVLPDGTPFSMPDLDALPPPYDVPDDCKAEAVCLAVPLARAGVTEVDFGDRDASDAAARLKVREHALRDASHAEDDPETIQTGALALRLLRERDATDAYARLAVARVAERRADGTVVLERDHVAPQTRIDATGQLSSAASLLHGLVRQRARVLAQRMGQQAQGVSELADFLMLQALNRAEPVLRQQAAAPIGHPAALHAECLRLAGDLATFAGADGGARHPREYPLYRHDDLRASFAPLVDDLRGMLSTVLERKAEQLELVPRSHGVRTALLPDADTTRTGGFVLAVNAQMPPEALRQRFLQQAKLGPVDRIRDLVNLQLPGIGLKPLPVAPRQLPFHAGCHYFELERGGELWQQLERSESLALFVGGDFPGLALELWVIRS